MAGSCVCLMLSWAMNETVELSVICKKIKKKNKNINKKQTLLMNSAFWQMKKIFQHGIKGTTWKTLEFTVAE